MILPFFKYKYTTIVYSMNSPYEIKLLEFLEIYYLFDLN